MNLTTLILQVIAEAGGTSVIVIFVLKRIIELKIDHISKYYELLISKELSKYTNELDNKSHKYKAFFDKKVTAYNEVLKKVIPCFENIKQIMPNGNHGIYCEIEIPKLESPITELKKSIENNMIMLDEDIVSKLESLIKCFNSQIAAYKSVLSENDNNCIDFSVSLNDLKVMESETINMLRNCCNNLEVMI